jgi:hypothetical protein
MYCIYYIELIFITFTTQQSRPLKHVLEIKFRKIKEIKNEREKTLKR